MNLKEILKSDDIVKSINDNTKYLLQIIPELEEYFYEHNHPHHIDGPIWRHVLLALSLSEKDFDMPMKKIIKVDFSFFNKKNKMIDKNKVQKISSNKEINSNNI